MKRSQRTANSAARALGRHPLPIKVLTLVGIIAASYLAIGSLILPMGNDQACYAWVGNVILKGGIPYVDAWDIKGPLTHYVFALIIAVFGDTDVAVRAFDLLTVIACCWLMRTTTLRINGHDPFGANIAVIIFALTYYQWTPWANVEPDEWGGMLAFVLVALLLNPRHSKRIYVASGVLIATASFFKPTFLIFSLLPPLALLLSRETFRTYVAKSSLFLISLLLTTTTLVLLLLRGHIREYIDALHFASSSYLQTRDASAYVRGIPQGLYVTGLLAPLLLGSAGVFFLFRQGLKSAAILLGAWLLIGLSIVVPYGLYSWPAYWSSALIALSVLSGVTVTYALDHAKTAGSRSIVTGMVALLLAWYAIAPWRIGEQLNGYRWPSLALALQTKEQRWVSLTGSYGESIVKVSGYLTAHSDPEDTVLLWSHDCLIQTFSKRMSPTRFGYSLPLSLEGPLREQYRRIFMTEIVARPPRYIVVDTNKEPWWLTNQSGTEQLEGFAPFRTFLHRYYRPGESAGDLQIWSRISPDSEIGVDRL